VVVTSGDLEVSWYEVGRGEPLVLVHGLGDDHRAWRKTLPGLMLKRRVLLYDLRGHGATSLGSPDGTLQQLGDDLVAWMDAIDLPRATIAGFSLGGTISMRAAIDHPDRVAALALIATSSRVGRGAAEWYRERAEMVTRGDPALRATLDADTEQVYGNRPAEAPDGIAIRRSSTQDPRGYGNACRAIEALNAHPLDPELPAIKAPTLIVAGTADANCPPRAAEIIAAGIAGSRLEIIEDAGHTIPVEHGDRVAELILSVS